MKSKLVFLFIALLAGCAQVAGQIVSEGLLRTQQVTFKRDIEVDHVKSLECVKYSIQQIMPETKITDVYEDVANHFRFEQKDHYGISGDVTVSPRGKKSIIYFDGVSWDGDNVLGYREPNEKINKILLEIEREIKTNCKVF